MRILSVATQLESGGAQTVAVDLHREFVRRGIPAELVFLYEKDPSVFPQRDYRTLWPTKPVSALDYARIGLRLRRTWREFGPTTVIAQTYSSYDLCALVKATGAKGDIVAVHQNIVAGFYPGIVLKADRVIRKVGLLAAEVSVSQPVLASLPPARHGDPPRSVVLNSQGLTRSSMSRADARASFGLPADAFLLGNIGRLMEQKHQTFLVDLLARMPDLHVAVLGEGPLREPLLAQAAALGVSDRLTLLGAVVRERVPDFLAAIDVFAMPSLHEGLSLAMLEALGAGVPFIGNDVPTIAEVVHGGNGGAGLVVPLDLDRWRHEIERLRDEPETRAALIARQRSRAADFTVETMADRYLQIARGLRN